MSSSTWPSLELETKQLSGENMSHSIHKVFKEFLSSTISDHQSYTCVKLGHGFDNVIPQGHKVNPQGVNVIPPWIIELDCI